MQNRVWDLRTLECKETFEGHTGSVNSVSIHHDGRTIVSGSSDNQIRYVLHIGRIC